MLIFTLGRYTPMPDKSETYRVEGDNEELVDPPRPSIPLLLTYIHTQHQAIKLFAYARNHRQSCPK